MKLLVKAFAGLANLAVVMGLLVFIPAGTIHYPEGWGLLASFLGPCLGVTLYLMRKDRGLLERRVHAGPVAETRPAQRVIQGFATASFLALLVVPALDHRFGWSRVPRAASVGGDLLVLLGFWIVFRVFRANSFTSATIEVDPSQQVISSGPYAVVRHPMYAGALVLLAGISPALGSWWGWLPLPAMVATIMWRLLDEERLLAAGLPGYAEYRQRVRFRLVPFVW